MKTAPLAVLLSSLLLTAGVHAGAADHISASNAWIRVLPGELPAGAYVTLTNHADQNAALNSASSTIYADVMLHKSSREGGMSRMSMVDSLSVPAHGEATLAPASYHLMLMKARHPVQVGDIVTLTLKFSDGSTLATDFTARPANAMDAGETPADANADSMNHPSAGDHGSH